MTDWEKTGFFKAFTPNAPGKKHPQTSFTKPENQYQLDKVRGLNGYCGLLSANAVLVDADDEASSNSLLTIIQSQKTPCMITQRDTGRGFHAMFIDDDSLITQNHTKVMLACGIVVDIKAGCKNGLDCLKFDNVERYPVYDEPPYKHFPKWLMPIKSVKLDFSTLVAGDGRNQALFNYILTLQDNDFTNDEARETIRLINRYILKEPLSDRELETILRDEAFQKRSFFKGRMFQHDKFATYLKNNNHIIKINGRLHVYQDGIYRADSENVERSMVEMIPSLKDSQRKETLKQLALICEIKQPAPPHQIAFSNGIYSLLNDSFSAFTPDVVITNKIKYPYNPNAYSAVMDQTLNRIACESPEIRALLEEMVGSCFYRANTLAGGGSFILTGEGANGKSTLLDALKYLLGDENIASLDLKELGDRFKTAELFGKLANIGDDIGSDYIANVATFRKLVTGQRVSAERKGQDPFEFDSYAKLLFSANAIPRLGRSKESYSIIRRLVIVPFDAKFTHDDPDFDPDIRYKLQDQQAMEYLIRVGLDGLKRVLANKKFTESEKVKQSLEEYSVENNPLLAFIEEAGIDAILNEPTRTVYIRYKEYCLSNQFEPINNMTFSKQLCRNAGLVVGFAKDHQRKTIKVFQKT